MMKVIVGLSSNQPCRYSQSVITLADRIPGQIAPMVSDCSIVKKLYVKFLKSLTVIRRMRMRMKVKKMKNLLLFQHRN